MFFKAIIATILAAGVAVRAEELGKKTSATCTTVVKTTSSCCPTIYGHTRTETMGCHGCALSTKTIGPSCGSETCSLQAPTSTKGTSTVQICRTRDDDKTTTDTSKPTKTTKIPKSTKTPKTTTTPTTTQSTIPLTSTVSSESRKGTPLCSIIVTELTEAGCTVTAAGTTVTSLTNCMGCKISTTTQALGARGSATVPSCTAQSSSLTVIDHSATSTATACETAAGPVR